MRFLALDFETGSVRAGEGGPVTLGVALMEDEAVVESREWLFQPEPRRKYEPGAEAVHGVTVAKMCAEGKTTRAILSELRDFALGHKAFATKIVAYNAPFDLAFYSDCLYLAGHSAGAGRFRHHAAPLIGPWHCAAILAREQLDLPRYKLDDVAAHFGLSRTTDLHGAREDAILAGRVYARLAAMHSEARRLAGVGS